MSDESQEGGDIDHVRLLDLQISSLNRTVAGVVMARYWAVSGDGELEGQLSGIDRRMDRAERHIEKARESIEALRDDMGAGDD